MPRCFIGSGLNFNLFSLSKRQNMNYVPNNIFGLCFNFSRSTTSVLRYKIESKRCYKISDVPAGMHLVVLLLSKNSQHWNSISSLCCHPASLRLCVRVLRVWESAERGACGGVRSEEWGEHHQLNLTTWSCPGSWPPRCLSGEAHQCHCLLQTPCLEEWRVDMLLLQILSILNERRL